MNYKVESSKDREFEDEKEQVKGYGETRVKDKMNLNNYKKMYLMSNNSIKFGYELVNLDKSNSKELVIDTENGITKDKVKEYELKTAMELYETNEILSDESIDNLLKAYLTIKEYEENLKIQQYYQEFIDNKGNVEDSQYYKTLENKQTKLTNDLQELRELKENYIEENVRVITRVVGVRE